MRALKRAGHHTATVDGSHLATCRMYEGADAVVAGYGKSLWSAFNGAAGSVAVCTLLGTAYVVPPLAAVAARDRRTRVIGALGYAAGVASRAMVARRTGERIIPDAAGQPASIAAFVALSIVSWQRHLGRDELLEGAARRHRRRAGTTDDRQRRHTEGRRRHRRGCRRHGRRRPARRAPAPRDGPRAVRNLRRQAGHLPPRRIRVRHRPEPVHPASGVPGPVPQDGRPARGGGRPAARGAGLRLPLRGRLLGDDSGRRPRQGGRRLRIGLRRQRRGGLAPSHRSRRTDVAHHQGALPAVASGGLAHPPATGQPVGHADGCAVHLPA